MNPEISEKRARRAARFFLKVQKELPKPRDEPRNQRKARKKIFRFFLKVRKEFPKSRDEGGSAEYGARARGDICQYAQKLNEMFGQSYKDIKKH